MVPYQAQPTIQALNSKAQRSLPGWHDFPALLYIKAGTPVLLMSQYTTGTPHLPDGPSPLLTVLQSFAIINYNHENNSFSESSEFFQSLTILRLILGTSDTNYNIVKHVTKRTFLLIERFVFNSFIPKEVGILLQTENTNLKVKEGSSWASLRGHFCRTREVLLTPMARSFSPSNFMKPMKCSN